IALGAIGSLLLAARVKRQTFGLEPHEIAGLLQEREATLQRISEGALATARDGTITLINDAAQRLLGLDEAAVGRKLAQVLPPGRLLAFLSGQLNDQDEVLLTGDHVLVASRRPVSVRDRDLGFVTTLRDATELSKIAPRVGVAGLTEALRAQAHEFSNRLHTIAGLVELGRGEEAMELIEQTSAVQQELTEAIMARVGDPVLAALLLAKAAIASERGIDFRVREVSGRAASALDPDDLITILGNLIDNALEAVAGQPGAWVEVSISRRDGHLVMRVRDSGPGVPEEVAHQVFREGFTTKRKPGGRRRGFGLTLIRRTVERAGGTVDFENQGGAVFTVRVPVREAISA
ncbi:MAG TPA: ATP-binding protein, partial [Candidatus Dormibacteraeota bacterium]